MTPDIEAAVTHARGWVDDPGAPADDDTDAIATKFARALLSLHAEVDAMRVVVEAAEAFIATGRAFEDKRTPEAELSRVLNETVPKLADAINAYVVACGGDPSKHVYGNTKRGDAVCRVENAVSDRGEVTDEIGRWVTTG